MLITNIGRKRKYQRTMLQSEKERNNTERERESARKQRCTKNVDEWS